MSRVAPIEAVIDLQCSADGCTNRWTSDFGARLCSRCLHAGHVRKSRPLPLNTAPAKPYSEPTEPDEEYIHVD